MPIEHAFVTRGRPSRRHLGGGCNGIRVQRHPLSQLFCGSGALCSEDAKHDAVPSVSVDFSIFGLGHGGRVDADQTLSSPGLERIGIASLLPLLLLQFLLLLTFLAICLAQWPRIEPDTAITIRAGMLGVSAMAVQNEVARISLNGAPSTAVMTTNITRSRSMSERYYSAAICTSRRSSAPSAPGWQSLGSWSAVPWPGMRVRFWPAVPDATGRHYPCRAHLGNRSDTGSSLGKESSMSDVEFKPTACAMSQCLPRNSGTPPKTQRERYRKKIVEVMRPLALEWGRASDLTYERATYRCHHR